MAGGADRGRAQILEDIATTRRKETGLHHANRGKPLEDLEHGEQNGEICILEESLVAARWMINWEGERPGVKELTSDGSWLGRKVK